MIRRCDYSRARGAALLLVLLLAVAIGLIVYFARTGKDGKSYVEQTIETKKRAKRVVTAVDLSSIYKSMLVVASMNDGKFPQTPEELVRQADIPSGYVWIPSRPFEDHLMTYVGGQDQTMPQSNILMYQSVVGDDGRSLVLYLDGRIERLTPQQVRAGLDRTQEYLD